MTGGRLDVYVKSITSEAPQIHSYELRPVSGGALPAFAAGAHIDLNLPNGMVRSYSLTNPASERGRYVIAVQRERASRGGSRWMHEQLRAGARLGISAPRNNFPLREDAAHSAFIAGGIGITPILSMVERLQGLGRPWELYYCARTRGAAAFLDRLEAAAAAPGARLHLNFDEEPGGKILDLAATLAAVPAHAHLYCCGPLPMLAAFEAATGGLPPERVHVEYFTAKEAAAKSGGFTVVLTTSGVELFVPPGKTILETMIDAGIDAPYSCMEGVCGTCETKVLEGIPDHRDLVLTKEEQESNATMMICCSGCKGGRLVLER